MQAAMAQNSTQWWAKPIRSMNNNTVAMVYAVTAGAQK